MTSFCLPPEFILTKVSASGVRYFFTGELTASETSTGETMLVAQTTLDPEEAHGYICREAPGALASLLNTFGIGGAPWGVSTFSKFRASRTCSARPQAPGKPPLP